ncbi:MAG: dihydropteroate synthase, partial [Actinomycetota bacterium]|nr:dihydropteroate synthase [Actinomycetota bacterium]
MGVVNVTPDSFSDGGDHATADAAVAHGLRLRDEGADLLDVGGESTRPGAARVPEDEELRRVVPVVARLAGPGALVSVDTVRASVARAALDAGAVVVNDVSAGRGDPGMLPLVAERGAAYVAMHSRGFGADMQSRAVYGDVVAEVAGELQERLDAARRAGVADERLVADPGLGFAKTAEHNWTLLAALDALHALGQPLLVGVSRKAFLGALLHAPDGTPRTPRERDAATAAVTVLAAQAGAWAVRVHDVGPSADA